MSDRDNSVFLADLKEWNLELNETQLLQLEKYYEMLVEKNKVMNLTAITEYEDVLKKHFLDSLALSQLMKLDGKKYKLLDMGTGAGFPGIPIKIAFPNIDITLIDSLNKRVIFLNEVITALSLTKIKAIHGRAEDFAKKDLLREKFDYCVSRAVANLSSLCEFCLPYVKIGGKFISYKSEKAKEELNASKNAISILGGGNVSCDKFLLPDTDFNRTFVIIEKVKDTPMRYPRKAGTPIKQPL